MKLCFVTARFPFPPDKGDSLRAHHQLRAIGRRHEVTLVSLCERRPTAEQLNEARSLCSAVHAVQLPRWRSFANAATGLFDRQPLQVSYYRSTRFRRALGKVLGATRFDAVHVSLLRMVPYVWEWADRVPVVVDLVDALSLNYRSRRDEATGLLKLAYDLEYRRVAAFEQAVARKFNRLAISSAVDRQLAGAPHANVIPNGVDLDAFAFRSDPRPPQTAIFTGNMAYPPNEDAARWFARQVWPLVRARRPTARFLIAGNAPTPRVRALSWEGNGVFVLGRVPSMADALAQATVSVCPLQSGSGIQNKVLEAMAVGTPVVSTSLGNQGVQARAGRELLVADDPAEFGRAVDWLFEDAEARALLAARARALVEERFLWESHGRRLEALYSGTELEPVSPEGSSVSAAT